MFRKALIFLVALTGLLAVASYFSPHWTVHRMRTAIDARDYERFSSYVNYAALQESFREQITASRHEGEGGSDDPLAALGRGVVGALAGPVLNAVLAPAAVIEMLNAGRPAITQAVLASSITRVPNTAKVVPDMQFDYLGWERVAFQRKNAAEEDGSFVLVREGLWSWKLAAVTWRD